MAPNKSLKKIIPIAYELRGLDNLVKNLVNFFNIHHFIRWLPTKPIIFTAEVEAKNNF